MEYTEALALWGEMKLRELGYTGDRFEGIKVDIEVNPGYNCCGGTDPECYCSLVESARAYVEITAKVVNGSSVDTIRCEADPYGSDFSTILREICAVGGGSISS